MSLGVLERPVTDPRLEQGEGRVAHIVKAGPNKTGAAIVLEAMVEGTEVEALCGHRWIPSRDPKQYPVCQKCEELYFAAEGLDAGLPSA